MILQNIVVPDYVCQYKELYYLCDEELKVNNDCILIPALKKVSFFSYMNMFDINAWKKYTTLVKVSFYVQIKGRGTLFLKVKTEEKEEVLKEFSLNQALSSDWKTLIYEIDLAKENGCCYFQVFTESEMLIRNACFTTANNEMANEVKIALNICTYHRNMEMQRNLKQLRNSRFFCSQDELFHRLQIVIVDNGSELERIDESYIQLVHNPNTGGSGGFKRGLEEIRMWRDDISHIVFMDDDVEFLLESLYRLYAILSFMRKEYQHESVAGRMFRTDICYVQYTAAEIWNKGDLRHIGLNADMTLEKEILQSNENANAEYGGWWFCCYPMEFAKENDPLPFFIHCDDVEYGLRHGGTPIILNGIQVWHETYEYRQSPVIAYYDMRNSLIVNEIYGFLPTKEELLDDWKSTISKYHVQGNYQMEYLAILAFAHFNKGILWLKKINSQKLNEYLMSFNANRWRNAIAWRITKLIFENTRGKK